MSASAFVFPDNPAALATSRELGRAGVSVTLVTALRGPASLSRFVRVAIAPDFYHDPKAWCDFVVDLAKQCSEPPVLFATEDAALLVADEFHAELSRVVRFPYPAPATAPAILDKLELYAAAARLGMAVPKFREAKDASLAVDASWLVKPSCRYHFDREHGVTSFLGLTGGSKAFEGSVGDATAQVLAAGFRCMVQERIPGPFEQLVSVGLCLDRNGRVLTSFVARKRCEYPEPFGDGLVVETVEDPGVLTPSVELLRRLGYWGICDVEYKRDERDGQLKLLDANPRVWLWVGLGTDSGCSSLVTTVYRLALGDGVLAESASRSEARARPGLTWVSPRGAAAFLLRQYSPARHGLGLPGRLTVGALRTMLRNLRAFRDPLYARPSSWPTLLAIAASRKTRRSPAPGGDETDSESHRNR